MHEKTKIDEYELIKNILLSNDFEILDESRNYLECDNNNIKIELSSFKNKAYFNINPTDKKDKSYLKIGFHKNELYLFDQNNLLSFPIVQLILDQIEPKNEIHVIMNKNNCVYDLRNKYFPTILLEYQDKTFYHSYKLKTLSFKFLKNNSEHLHLIKTKILDIESIKNDLSYFENKNFDREAISVLYTFMDFEKLFDLIELFPNVCAIINKKESASEFYTSFHKDFNLFDSKKNYCIIKQSLNFDNETIKNIEKKRIINFLHIF